MGTPEFAAAALNALIDNGENIVGVVSQPDKPKGRGMTLTPTPVKEAALSHDIEVFQPEKIKNGELDEFLKKTDPELIIVVAYGKILPESVLNYPKYGAVNAHASLLPKYRGAAPIQRAVIDGEKETGVTAMYMEKGLDTGNIIISKRIPIEDDDTAASLHDKLAALSGEVLIETIERFKKGDFSSTKQDDSKATYAKMLEKSEGEIDWSKSVDEVYNLIRGMDSWPMAYTYLNGKRFVPYSCKKTDGVGQAGEIIGISKESLVVACGLGAIEIGEVKFDGKKKMTVRDYLVGHKIEKHEKLGR